MDSVQRERISFEKLFYSEVPVITVQSVLGDLNLLIDSGATSNVIDSKLVKDLNLDFKCECKSFGGDTFLSKEYLLDIIIGSTPHLIEVRFTDLNNIDSFFDFTIHGVLGSRFLEENNAIIDYGNKVLSI